MVSDVRVEDMSNDLQSMTPDPATVESPTPTRRAVIEVASAGIAAVALPGAARASSAGGGVGGTGGGGGGGGTGEYGGGQAGESGGSGRTVLIIEAAPG
jgi:hypothetical protein